MEIRKDRLHSPREVGEGKGWDEGTLAENRVLHTLHYRRPDIEQSLHPLFALQAGMAPLLINLEIVSRSAVKIGPNASLYWEQLRG